MRREVTLSN